MESLGMTNIPEGINKSSNKDLTSEKITHIFAEKIAPLFVKDKVYTQNEIKIFESRVLNYIQDVQSCAYKGYSYNIRRLAKIISNSDIHSFNKKCGYFDYESNLLDEDRYGLSIAGINAVIKDLKTKEQYHDLSATVCNDYELIAKIEERFAQGDGNESFIVFTQDRTHFLTLHIEKKDDDYKIFFIDSLSSKYEYIKSTPGKFLTQYLLRPLLSKGSVELFSYMNRPRQADMMNCALFSLHDVKSIHKLKKSVNLFEFLEKQSERKGTIQVKSAESSKSVAVNGVRILPPYFMQLTQSLTILNKYLKKMPGSDDLTKLKQKIDKHAVLQAAEEDSPEKTINLSAENKYVKYAAKLIKKWFQSL